MEEKTVNQETKALEEKTFTQEELNTIVNDRLARERKKYEGVDLEALKAKAAQFDKMEEANKTELEKANDRANKLAAELEGIKKAEELREIRQRVAEKTGVPVNLITAETEDACEEQAKAISAWARPDGYPVIRDGGETNHVIKPATRDEFAKWAATVNS